MKLLTIIAIATIVSAAWAQWQPYNDGAGGLLQQLCSGTVAPVGAAPSDDFCELININPQAARNQLSKMIVANRRHGNPRLLYFNPKLFGDAATTPPVELLRPWMKRDGWEVIASDERNGTGARFGFTHPTESGFEIMVRQSVRRYNSGERRAYLPDVEAAGEYRAIVFRRWDHPDPSPSIIVRMESARQASAWISAMLDAFGKMCARGESCIDGVHDRENAEHWARTEAQSFRWDVTECRAMLYRAFYAYGSWFVAPISEPVRSDELRALEGCD